MKSKPVGDKRIAGGGNARRVEVGGWTNIGLDAAEDCVHNLHS